MSTILVNKDTIQKLLDYVGEQEAQDYADCAADDWTEAELEKHAYALVMELQNCINGD